MRTFGQNRARPKYLADSGWNYHWTLPEDDVTLIRAVVPGPFVRPRLVKAVPYVVFSRSPEKGSRPAKRLRNGIPDPWLDYLAWKESRQEERKSCGRDLRLTWEYTRFTDYVWNQRGLPLVQGIPDPWKSGKSCDCEFRVEDFLLADIRNDIPKELHKKKDKKPAIPIQDDALENSKTRKCGKPYCSIKQEEFDELYRTLDNLNQELHQKKLAQGHRLETIRKSKVKRSKKQRSRSRERSMEWAKVEFIKRKEKSSTSVEHKESNGKLKSDRSSSHFSSLSKTSLSSYVQDEVKVHYVKAPPKSCSTGNRPPEKGRSYTKLKSSDFIPKRESPPPSKVTKGILKEPKPPPIPVHQPKKSVKPTSPAPGKKSSPKPSAKPTPIPTSKVLVKKPAVTPKAPIIVPDQLPDRSTAVQSREKLQKVVMRLDDRIKTTQNILDSMDSSTTRLYCDGRSYPCPRGRQRGAGTWNENKEEEEEEEEEFESREEPVEYLNGGDETEEEDEAYQRSLSRRCSAAGMSTEKKDDKMVVLSFSSESQ